MKSKIELDYVKLVNTIIKRIVLCVFIWLLGDLLYTILSNKEINSRITVSVAIIIAIMNLMLKFLDEITK